MVAMASPLIFVTARRRNGFAGIHDVLTATRVTLKPRFQPRPALPPAFEAPPEVKTLPLVGPYHVLDRIGRHNGAELLCGFDARLLRRVWIRKQPPGTPAIPAGYRQLSRPGRLRWLTARRTETEAWDAYEAALGRPLLGLIARPQPWSSVRYWLLDLAEELLAASRDNTLPAELSLERVWITAEGRAKLLDFEAPNRDDAKPGTPSQTRFSVSAPQAFLRLVATSALAGRVTDTSEDDSGVSVPLPVHASRFLETLKSGADLEQSLAALRSVLGLPAQVSRTRRAPPAGLLVSVSSRRGRLSVGNDRLGAKGPD